MTALSFETIVGRLHWRLAALRFPLRRVHELDPRWWPRVEGELSSPESIVEQAERRLAEFGHLAPNQLIERYRTENRMPDFFGHPSWPEDKGTVAVAIIDGKPMFGVNARALGRRQADTMAADAMRDVLVSKYPDVMETRYLGRMPNDAIYHAEATILLRAARSHGGSLAGRELEVHVDRTICWRCDVVLPLVARELGNPTVTFVEPGGARWVLRNGQWDLP
jgi:hypothetical protein